MDEIINIICERLEKSKLIRYAERNCGQLLAEQPQVNFPCCLVDIVLVEFEQAGMGGQTAVADIEFTFADLYSAKHNHSVLSVIDAAHQLLQGWGCHCFTPLFRTSLRRSSATPGYDEYVVTYRTSFFVPKVQRTVEVLAEPSVVVE